MKSVLWFLAGLAGLAALAWFVWPSLAPWIDQARGIEPVRVREVSPLR